MFARVAVNSIPCVVVFLVPFAAHPGRLLHPAPWLAFGIALVTLITQPPLDLHEVSSRDAADRCSALAILGAMIAAQLLATIDFARGPVIPVGWGFAIGSALALAGISLRLWAIRTLGRFFTSTVRVVGDQVVVCSGPYRALRHPSYTGALLAAFGIAVALESRIGAALVLGLCVPAYLYRIAAEERAMVRQLGEAYLAYRRGTRGLVPGLW